MNYLVDIHSPTWVAVEEVANKETDLADESLRIHGTDLATTEYLRGKIDALSEILALGTPNPG